MTDTTILTNQQVKDILNLIPVGMKIEVDWTSDRGGSGRDVGVLLLEDGTFYLMKKPHELTPFFHPSISYTRVEMCRAQSQTAARRARAATLALDQAARPQPPAERREEDPPGEVALEDTQPRLVDTTRRPTQAPPTQEQLPSPQASNLGQLPTFYGGEVYQLLRNTADTHGAQTNNSPYQQLPTTHLDASLALEVVRQRGDPRRVKVWGAAHWDFRTVQNPTLPWSFFDLLGYRIRYQDASEAARRWRDDKDHAKDRFEVEVNKYLPRHKVTNSSVSTGYLIKIHWCEGMCHDMLATYALPVTPEEAKTWLIAGVTLMEAYCHYKGANAKAGTLWQNFDRLYGMKKVDFEDTFHPSNNNNINRH